MGKRGPKSKRKVNLEWCSDFAYAIGLIASDGCLYNNGRSIALVSKDKEQVDNFQKALGISQKIGLTYGHDKIQAFRVQLSDVYFWDFLNSIGLTPNKSKTIEKVDIPDQFFFDFVRGLFDGDGSIHSYYDKRWKNSFMFYLSFTSAAKVFIEWFQNEIEVRLNIKGCITNSEGTSWYQLKYAKKETQILLSNMYKDECLCLSRKKLKIATILAMIGQPRIEVSID